MKNLLPCLAVALGAAALAAPARAGDVGVSLSISQPGLYGRIDINQPPPPVALVYRQPIVVVRPAVRVVEAPVYLHVPPGHEKHWSKHCAQYDACGRPVYFVRDSYYQQHYGRHEERAKEKHEKAHGRGHDKGRDRHD